jgi:hypothetical protein
MPADSAEDGSLFRTVGDYSPITDAPRAAHIYRNQVTRTPMPDSESPSFGQRCTRSCATPGRESARVPRDAADRRQSVLAAAFSSSQLTGPRSQMAAAFRRQPREFGSLARIPPRIRFFTRKDYVLRPDSGSREYQRNNQTNFTRNGVRD